MFSLSNKIKSPDDEEDQDCDNSLVKQPHQQTFLTYNYNHHFEHTHDFTATSWIAHNQKSPDFESSNPMKFSLVQEGFDLASQKLKSKKRKTGDFETLATAAGKTWVFETRGGGGRVVQSTGRKDRHSKVRTARGPRDRRVRLSPRTAIQFYDVQDRLGYDRPSKAIDWLIKEAKAAIDALNEHSNGTENRGGFLIEKNGGNDAVSGFGFCVDGAAPQLPTAEFQTQNFNASADLILNQSYQQGFCSAFSETNWEIARLQKMLNWNSGNENSGNYAAALHSPAATISGHHGGGHVFSQREPLQSSFVNYSPMSNADFPAFNFCNELLNVTASATLMKENEREKINSEIDY